MKPHLSLFLRSALFRCVTTVALITTCSSFVYADTELTDNDTPLTLTFSEAEAPIVLLSEDDLLVTGTGNSAFLTAAALPPSSDGLILAGTYANGTYTRSEQTEHLTDSQNMQSYESILFDENKVVSSSSNALGGVIYAYNASNGTPLTFTDNGNITFSGNAASSSSSYAYGGAIYAKYNSTLTFTSNGAITFSGNMANGSSNALGGAIYAEKKSAMSFSGSNDITFSGNMVSAKGSYSYARGGAIYAYDNSPLTFTSNGNITFSGNTAINSSMYAYGGAIDAISALTFTGNKNGAPSNSSRG